MILFECPHCRALLLMENPKSTIETPRCPVRSCKSDLMELVSTQDETILGLAQFVLTVGKPARTAP